MSLKQLTLCDIEISEEVETEDGVKTCVYCFETKPLEDFPKHIGHKDNLDTRCRECIKTQSKIRAELHKNAPPKPELCECCGKIPRKHMALDHDHQTNQFRGWLCDKCNVGIGLLGDDLQGIANAMNYLLSKQS